jgi:hypothetical protein
VRLLDERTWPMSTDDRYPVAMWIALQHLRSQSTRTQGEEISRTFFKPTWVSRRPSRSVSDSSYLQRPRTRRWSGCAPACSPALTRSRWATTSTCKSLPGRCPA